MAKCASRLLRAAEVLGGVPPTCALDADYTAASDLALVKRSETAGQSTTFHHAAM